MKRIMSLFLCVIIAVSVSGCAKTVIPNSVEAKKKMEELGYVTSLSIQTEKEVVVFDVKQITSLTAEKNGDFLEVYYFTSEEDTEKFYEIRSHTLRSNVEVIKKNRYSVYRGTKQAVQDFLS